MRCPLCGSPRTRRIIHEPEWAIHACRGCTNAWTSPRPQQLEYEREDFHNESLGSPGPEGAIADRVLPGAWQRALDMQVSLLGRYLAPKSTVLEVGCGEGILLGQLKASSFEVMGVEPSEVASARARRRSLDVVTGYFPNSQVRGPFDAVVLSQVLEHVADPGACLAEIARIAPKGYLLLIQTNYRGLVPRLQRGRWYAWAPQQHYWHFTPHGLNRMATEAGFTPVACEFSSLVHYDARVACALVRRAGRIHALRPWLFDQFHALYHLG